MHTKIMNIWLEFMIATINKEKLLTKKSLEAAFKMFDIVIEYYVLYIKVS